MLSELYIENVAVIKELNIEFQEGLNVFTGETGAGKSILIDAVNAILGARTSKGIIRHGMERAQIYAVFSGVSKEVWDLVKEYGIEKEDNLILFRQIFTDGRNVCKINGKPATVAMLRDVGSTLIHIHGQHDNQFLLNEENHLSFIDQFGGTKKLLEDYQNSFHKLLKAKRQLNQLLDLDFDKEKRLELLAYEIDEIETANISDNEEDYLKGQRAAYQNSEKVLQALSDVVNLLSGENALETNTLSMLSYGMSQLEGISHVSDKLQSLSEQITNTYYAVDELNSSLVSQIEEYQLEIDIDELEERLKLISQIKQKYGETKEEIERFLEEAKEESQLLQNQELEISDLEDKADALLDEVEQKGSALTKKRKQAAEVFCKQLKEQLKFLNMQSVTVQAQFTDTKFTSHGKDNMVLLFSTNPGQPAKSISKVASGGELSRIMLAIKTISAKKDRVGSLIFDEIDTGVSGDGSIKIGLKLKEVSQNTQVICVTHSPSIASFADRHFFIDKEIRQNQTFTKVKQLLEEERAGELARIISGNAVSEQTIQTAKELLKNAQK